MIVVPPVVGMGTVHMHGWWALFAVGSGTKVHGEAKAHITHITPTSDPKDDP
jgi:hypothetical protein